MNLTTTYLGRKLKNPLVASASPLSHNLDNIRRLEDAGAAAVVLFSLFEEEILHESRELDHYLTYGTESYAEALSYFPAPHEFYLGPDEYLEHIRRAKAAVDIPIIGSLNGVSTGGWINYARKIESAGADAIELNLYYIPTDPALASDDVERMYLNTLKAVKASVNIPVALKLSPFFSAMANMAKQFDAAGANALVLFNRFYQPDIDLENLEVVPNVILSTPQSMRLPLRWIAILYGKIKADLAATSGIHTAADVLKMLMAGANVTMMASALLHNGIGHLSKVLREMEIWMEEHEYESVQQMQGSMSQKSVAEPAAFERANYIKALHSFQSI
ncbi:MAG: dihydroorotate dehydrogenase-like protein [candidate division KSB1 bacterium]|nr:dihydroorotate dehydrogenase-like protein [candidate division KSB1 bacterium]MDZ7367595.1 dihydroorotate dehydrogenase-like protein [candidate division KSB1 bacterium]MDZ7405387.1 dihydroorotate dehydrogenase-like protein [candidate division KSB1 bacterium]